MRPIIVVLCAVLVSASQAAEPPPGFTSLFNGRDLSGWRGRPHLDPRQEAVGSAADRAARQNRWNDDLAAHWKVRDGVIVSDGDGVFLTTVRDYGDFELLIDWMLPAPCADSGIYLRGIPQVQIWDPACQRDFQHGCQKGSGGLWNNPADAPGKWPLVKADRPIGEWNSARITMAGENVTVVLNGQLVVDAAPLANFFDKGKPLPTAGPIQIQTHGAPMHVRNVFIREVPPVDGSAAAAGPAAPETGFAPLFDGVSLAGWQGATQGYEVVDGELRCRKGAGGKLLTTREFSDFVLRFDFRLTPGANNGIGIRAPVEGDAAFNAMELQILDDAHPKYASLKPWQFHGSIYGVVAAERGSLKPAGEWNSQEVTVQGSKVKVVLNGKTIVDSDIAPFRDGQPTLDGRGHPGLARTSGYVGFLGHGDEVHFRNISIKELE